MLFIAICYDEKNNIKSRFSFQLFAKTENTGFFYRDQLSLFLANFREDFAMKKKLSVKKRGKYENDLDVHVLQGFEMSAHLFV